MDTSLEIIQSVNNGQFTQARNQLKDSSLQLWEVLECYIQTFDPTHSEILFFVKVMDKR